MINSSTHTPLHVVHSTCFGLHHASIVILYIVEVCAQVERVIRIFTKRIKNMKHLTYYQQSRVPGLTTVLEQRRRFTDLLLAYRCIHGHAAAPEAIGLHLFSIRTRCDGLRLSQYCPKSQILLNCF